VLKILYPITLSAVSAVNLIFVTGAFPELFNLIKIVLLSSGLGIKDRSICGWKYDEIKILIKAPLKITVNAEVKIGIIKLCLNPNNYFVDIQLV
jgi:hypothetical protein